VIVPNSASAVRGCAGQLWESDRIAIHTQADLQRRAALLLRRPQRRSTGQPRCVRACGDLGLISILAAPGSLVYRYPDFLFLPSGRAECVTVGIHILASKGSYGHSAGVQMVDRELSLQHVCRIWAMGGQIKHVFGDETTRLPHAVFCRFWRSWQKIPFLLYPRTRRAVEDLVKYAV